MLLVRMLPGCLKPKHGFVQFGVVGIDLPRKEAAQPPRRPSRDTARSHEGPYVEGSSDGARRPSTGSAPSAEGTRDCLTL